ncbi:tyrosine-type recombinase/integrase [Plantibacter sp. T3]|uniref:tyrosine-type recombinase/integrase n=1 Tax=Plantibacter sp. T3 TaxID=2653161 RepID=UPI00135A9096|nr:tyrosine-type recombinase/integrase [Plantibacter sp. T3]
MISPRANSTSGKRLNAWELPTAWLSVRRSQLAPVDHSASDIAVEKLHSRQRSQRIERELAGESWQENGLVFSTGIGTMIEPSNLRRSFDQAITTTGVRRIRFHDMRHTCASLLLARGVPLRVVMDVLGHSTMSITSDL